MKNLLLLAFCLSFQATSFAFDGFEHAVSEKNIKSYSRTEYEVSSKFGQYYRTVTLREELKVSNGLITEKSECNEKNELQNKIVFQYDEKFNLKESIKLDAAEKVISRKAMEYDSDGRMAIADEYDADGKLMTRTIYKYEDGKNTESIYDGNGDLTCRTISYLDAEDKIADCYRYKGNGSLEMLAKYTYAGDSQILTEDYFNSQMIFFGKKCNKYDAKGNLIEVQEYSDKNELIKRIVIKNNADGLPERMSFYNVSEKFGSTANELYRISDFEFVKNGGSSKN